MKPAAKPKPRTKWRLTIEIDRPDTLGDMPGLPFTAVVADMLQLHVNHLRTIMAAWNKGKYSVGPDREGEETVCGVTLRWRAEDITD